MTPRPILFVDHADALGGAERSLLLLMTFLNHARWQPHLVAPPGQLAGKADHAGIPVHTLDLPRLRGSFRSPPDWWKGAGNISAIARRVGAALIHSNTVRASAYAAPAARLARLPFVWHMRDFWLLEAEPASKLADRIGKLLIGRAAAAVITNSHAVAAHLPSSANAFVLHNGIDLSSFDASNSTPGNRAAMCQEAGFHPAAPLVGMVGRLRPTKGQHSFLHMAGKLAETVPDCRFLVVGGDPFRVGDDYEARLTALCSQLGLEDRVHWTGQLSDVRPALEAMDVFVHPGTPEPFGLVNIEAMAMGKPVVAFGHGALPEIVAHDETGILVPPDDIGALTGAVSRLLGDVPLSQRMGLAGRRRVEEYFGIERTVAELEAFYERMLARN